MIDIANDNSSLKTKKSSSYGLDNIAFSLNISTLQHHIVVPLVCACYSNLLSKEENKSLERDDYLRLILTHTYLYI